MKKEIKLINAIFENDIEYIKNCSSFLLKEFLMKNIDNYSEYQKIILNKSYLELIKIQKDLELNEITKF
jgi:hypothetical protein